MSDERTANKCGCEGETAYGISRGKDVFDAGVEEDGQKTDMQYITEIESYQSEKKIRGDSGKI